MSGLGWKGRTVRCVRLKASDSESKSDSARRQWFGKHDRPSRDLDNGQTEVREFSGNGRLRKPSRGCAMPFSTLDILDRRRPSSALWYSWLQIPTSPSLWLHYRPRFCFKGPQTSVIHRDPDTVSLSRSQETSVNIYIGLLQLSPLSLAPFAHQSLRTNTIG